MSRRCGSRARVGVTLLAFAGLVLMNGIAMATEADDLHGTDWNVDR